MVKLAFPLLMCLVVLYLLRKGRLNLDLSGLLILALVAVMALSISEAALEWMAAMMSIVFVPLAIVALAIGLLLCIVITLAVMVSDSRKRQNLLLRKVAELELTLLGRPDGGGGGESPPSAPSDGTMSR
jgi:hypothetical protein